MSKIAKQIEIVLGPVLDEKKDLEGRLNAAKAKILFLEDELKKQGQLTEENFNMYLSYRDRLEKAESHVSRLVKNKTLRLKESLKQKESAEKIDKTLAALYNKIAMKEKRIGELKYEILSLKASSSKRDGARKVSLKFASDRVKFLEEKNINLSELYRDQSRCISGLRSRIDNLLLANEAAKEEEIRLIEEIRSLKATPLRINIGSIKDSIIRIMKVCLINNGGKPVTMRDLTEESFYLSFCPVRDLDEAAVSLIREGKLNIDDSDVDFHQHIAFSLPCRKGFIEFPDFDSSAEGKKIHQENVDSAVCVLIDLFLTIKPKGCFTWASLEEQCPVVADWDWSFAKEVIDAAVADEVIIRHENESPIGWFTLFSLPEVISVDELSIEEGIEIIVGIFEKEEKNNGYSSVILSSVLKEYKYVSGWSDSFFDAVIKSANIERKIKIHLKRLTDESAEFIELRQDK